MKYQLVIKFDTDSDDEANSLATDIEQTLLAFMVGDHTLLISPVTLTPDPMPVPHANHMWVPDDEKREWACDIEFCQARDPYLPGQRVLRKFGRVVGMTNDPALPLEWEKRAGE